MSSTLLKLVYMNFKDWIMGKFLEWEKETGKRQSFSAYGRYLGIKQSTFSQWLNGSSVPSYENAVSISLKVGEQVYDVLGYARPVEVFPFALRSALESARVKIIEAGVSGDSPEAESIIISAMNAAGYTLIPTSKDESENNSTATPFR